MNAELDFDIPDGKLIAQIARCSILRCDLMNLGIGRGYI